MQSKIVFQNAVQRCKEADIPDPELEVSLLLSHVLRMQRTAVLLAGEQVLSQEQRDIFEKNLTRRLAREPLAYITGEKEFWSLDFMVSRDVLIPRPETEILLEKTLSVLKRPEGKSAGTINLLELGTGSGVIAIILALELAAVKVTAIDSSYKALKVARHNAKRHKVAERINFINCSWFDGLEAAPVFDAVVSNPPYIAGEVLARPFGRTADALQPEVGKYEPRLALDGGKGGVREIRKIAAGLGRVLKPRGWFFMEIGGDQQKEVSDIFSRTASFDSLAFYNDYAGLPRVFQARRK